MFCLSFALILKVMVYAVAELRYGVVARKRSNGFK